VPHEKRQGTALPSDDLSHSWFGAVEFAIAIGIAYFLAARLGLAIRAEGVAVAAISTSWRLAHRSSCSCAIENAGLAVST
jgi:hypothetical protein